MTFRREATATAICLASWSLPDDSIRLSSLELPEVMFRYMSMLFETGGGLICGKIKVAVSKHNLVYMHRLDFGFEILIHKAEIKGVFLHILSPVILISRSIPLAPTPQTIKR